MIIMKLSGFQRLWVVTTIIIFVIAVFFTIVLFPKKSEIMSRWTYETIEVVKKPGDYSFEIRDAYKDYGDKELIDKIHEKEKNPFTKIRFDEIDRRYKNELESLFTKQAKHILIAFVAYFCVILALYGFGWSIGWIYRGFKSTRSIL
jgi:hypothetical protein